MGLNFKKSKSNGRARLNINKRGLSVSYKVSKFIRITKSKGVLYVTFRIPKTGLSYTKKIDFNKTER